MNILALETSTGGNSVAVVAGLHTMGERWSIRALPHNVGQAETLLPLIREVMGDMELHFKDLDLLAADTGPGSFTGIRTGLAAARGLALAAGKPLVGASSLDVMAAAVATAARSPFAVAIDARNGELYAATYDATGKPASAPRLLTKADTASLVNAGLSAACGPGGQLLAAWIGEQGGHLDVIATVQAPTARQLAIMAPTVPRTDRVSPLYLRDADAKPPAPSPVLRQTTP